MTLIRSRSNGLIINGATEAARDVIRTNAGTLAEIVGGTRPVPAPTELPPPPQGAPAPAAGGYPCKMRPHFAWGPGEGGGSASDDAADASPDSTAERPNPTPDPTPTGGGEPSLRDAAPRKKKGQPETDAVEEL